MVQEGCLSIGINANDITDDRGAGPVGRFRTRPLLDTSVPSAAHARTSQLLPTSRTHCQMC
jgi:hypothetical protein